MIQKTKAYLTIDDSPTRHTDDLTDWLVARDIPATFFCIGSAYKDMHVQCEGMEQNPDPIVRAIQKGFLVGNHTWTHRRSSELSYEDVIDEIEKTEKMIERLYKQADKARPVKTIRFPHIDRGCGGWVVDYNAAENHKETLEKLFTDGLNITLVTPTSEQVEKKAKIQDYLKREGFTADIYKGVTFDWYTGTEMKDARDALYTFSTSDWMVNPDFIEYSKGWPYKTVAALKEKIDSDPHLKDNSSAHIILAHDHNGLFTATTALIEHMQDKNIGFIEAVS